MSAVRSTGASPLVLVVGDVPSGLLDTLAGSDGSVATVSDPTDTVSAVEDGDCDCLLVGTGLAGTTAPAVVAELRATHADVPVFVVVEDGADRGAALDAGATDCLDASLATTHPETLAARVRGVLERRSDGTAANRYRRLIEHSTDIVTVVNADGSIQYQSPAVEELLGYDQDELVGEFVFNYVHPEDRDAVREAFIELVGKDETTTETVTYRFRHADGSWAWLETTGSNQTHTSVEGYVFNSRDVTERKERERELKRYETLVRAIPDEVYTMDEDGYHTSVVPPAGRDETIAGYDPGEMVGEHASMVMDEDDLERGREAIQKLVADEDREHISFEMDIVTSDGERIPHENHVAILPSEDDQFRGTVGVLRDISDRKEREEKLEQIQRHVTDVVWMTDPEKNSMDFVSQAYEDVWGRSTASLRERPESFVEAVHEDDRERVRGALADQQQNPDDYDETYRVVQPDGEVRWVRDHSSGVYRDGDLVRIVGVATDITESKERERLLEQHETVVQNAQDGVFLVDVTDDGRFEVAQVNPAYESMSNLDGADIVGKTPREIFGDEVGGHIAAKFNECLDRRTNIEFESTFDIPDVPTHWHSHIAPVVVDGEVQKIVGSTRDITDRKEREQELRLKDRVIAEAPVGIAIADATRPNTPIVHANDGFEAVTGYDETDARGRPLPFLAGPETDDGKLSTLLTALDRRETATVELLLYGQDGTPNWTRVGVAPVRGDAGEVTHVVAFLEDITDQKEYEQWIERQFDEFSDVIAEDLGEPIERARAHLEDSDAGDENVESAREWLDRAERLVNDLTTVHSFDVKPREVSEAARGNSRADE